MKALLIRRANQADSRTVQQLIVKAYQVSVRYGIRFAAASIPLNRVLQDILKHRVYVLYLNQRPIGSVTIRRRSFGYEISHLAVIPKFQGSGHGRQLLQFAERHIRTLGQREVHLFTAENHPWLPAFYTRYGYKKVHHYKSKRGLWIGHYVKTLEKPLR